LTSQKNGSIQAVPQAPRGDGAMREFEGAKLPIDSVSPRTRDLGKVCLADIYVCDALPPVACNSVSIHQGTFSR
jgi:hypothetical protein